MINRQIARFNGWRAPKMGHMLSARGNQSAHKRTGKIEAVQGCWFGVCGLWFLVSGSEFPVQSSEANPRTPKPEP